MATADGKTVYVACEDSNKVLIVDLAGKVTGQIDMSAKPTGSVLSPNKKQLFVTCSGSTGKVAVVDLATNKVVATWAVGYSPTGPVVSPDGKTLYVCYRFKNQIGLVDTTSGKEIGRVAATREPVAAAVTPDGKSLFVANLIPIGRADSYNVASVVTVVDTASRKASSIRLPNGSSSLHGVAITPDGKYALVTHILARYQMPTTQLERGWMNTNALSIIDVKTKKLVNTVLLDDVDLGAGEPLGCCLHGRRENRLCHPCRFA